MLNRLDTAVVRARRQVEYLRLLEVASKGHGTVYHPVSHRIAGYNFGSRVRPDVAPIAVNASGFETVASFLARGGRIVTGAPKVAHGAMLVETIKSGTTRVAVSRG